VPLSGAAEGYPGDLIIGGAGTRELRAEVKCRAEADGWVVVKRWLGDNDLLFLIEDRKDPLIVLPWSVFTQLLRDSLDLSGLRLDGEGDFSDDSRDDDPDAPFDFSDYDHV
jgi:hypothetical protein